MTMQTAPLRGICIMRCNDQLNGYPTCMALMKRAISAKLNVHALLFYNLQKNLPAFLRENTNFKAAEFFTLHSLEELRKYLATQNLSKSSLIFIDSLSFLIDQLSLPSTSLLLNQLSELSAGVLALLGNDQGIEQEEWRRLQSISSTIFQLQLSDDGYEDDGKDAAFVLCKTMSRKKDETFETKIEQFTIEPNYSIQSAAYTAPDSAARIAKEIQHLTLMETHKKSNGFLSAHQHNNTDFAKLPFDVGLNLSEQERRAKANVKLPYMAAQSEKGLVGLNIASGKKVRAGGQIIYTPEKEDDFDESDPDDDLMI